MKKYLIPLFVLTVWFCLNQPIFAAYGKKSPPPPEVQAPEVQTPAVEAPAAEGTPAPVVGKAVIEGTAEGVALDGVVTFLQTPDGLTVAAEINNIPNPGKHGFHVHEVGSCDDGGKAAGGHFNPDGVPQGELAHQGHELAHAGDMGNILADETGKALYSG